jgi:aspartate-semialdehyde dehydrogenase
MPLSVIQRLAPLEEVIVVSYQAASGAGAAGLATLAAEAREDAGLPRTGAAASPFAARLSRNVIPAIAELDAHGISGEEQKISEELRKILRLPKLLVESTTARVPVERCHSVAVHLRVRGELDPAGVRAALREAPGIRLEEDPHGPRPLESALTDAVHVGRIRAGSRGPGSLCFFAALNALQIAAALPAER